MSGELLIIRDPEEDLAILNNLLDKLVGRIVPPNEQNRKEAFNQALKEIYEKHKGVPELYVTKWSRNEINEVLWHLYSYGVT